MTVGARVRDKPLVRHRRAQSAKGCDVSLFAQDWAASEQQALSVISTSPTGLSMRDDRPPRRNVLPKERKKAFNISRDGKTPRAGGKRGPDQ
jgi:hypothetical protein